MFKKTNPIIYNAIIVLFFVGLFSSCVSSEKIVYFQNSATEVSNKILQNFEPTIGIDDLLTINISTTDVEAAAPFNLFEGTQNSLRNSRPLPYLVNALGEIDFPVIGALKVSGFTTKELTEKIKIVLKEYLIKPVVNIRLVNFKVTILGEVKNPGSYNVPSERITIFEALGLAGDLLLQGNRKKVVLVREKEGERTSVNIDLTNKELFNTPYYYLAQNDLLYVEPNKAKINSSAVGSNTGVILSGVSILITLVALLTR